MIDFDFDPPMGRDPQVRVAEPEQKVEIATSMPVAMSSGIEVNDWAALRDYVVSQIERYHGRFPRNPAQESGIFKAFINRWGDQAMPIARVAFEVHQGIWHNAPVRVQRFCIGSDPYFAQVIAQGLD